MKTKLLFFSLLMLAIGGSLSAQSNIGGGSSSASTSVIDATASKYGLKADVKRCNGWGSQATLTITNASNTVVCSTANFTSADVGKIIFATNWTGVDTNYTTAGVIIGQGVINTVVNSTTVTVCTTIGACTPVNAIQSSTGTNGSLFWGTDDTAALALAWTDASTGSVCQTLLLPGKMMFVSSQLFNTATCPFSGTGNSAYASITSWAVGGGTLVPIPNFSFAGIPVNSVFFGFRAAGVYNLTIDCGGNSMNGTTHAFSWVVAQVDGTISNLMINGCGAQSTSLIGVSLGDGAHLFSAITIDGSGSTCIAMSGSAKAYELFGGNCASTTMQVSNAGSLIPAYCNGCAYQHAGGSTTPVTITGDFIDEDGACIPGGSATVCYIVNGANSTLRLQNFRSVGNATASFAGFVAVTGANSTAWIENSSVATSGTSAFALNNTVATGRMFIRNSSITSSGITANCFSGTAGAQFVDQGGNTFTCTAFSSGGGSFVNFTNSASGTACATGNFALTSGWGTSAVASVAANGNILGCHVNITGAAGSAGPVLTWTYPQAPGLAPASCHITGTTASLTGIQVGTPGTTSVAFTFVGTPTTVTYSFDVGCP